MTVIDRAAPTATITLARADLAYGLRAAAGLKAKHVHLAFAEGTVRLLAFTPDTSVRVDIGDDCDGDGYAVLPRTTLAGILPYCTADLKVSVFEEHVEIESGSSTFEIRQIRLDLAGTFKHPRADDITEIAGTYDAPTLVEILRRVLPFAARDQTRPVLCGIVLYPTAQVAVATDSYRLAIVRHGDQRRDIKDEKPIYLGVFGALSVQRMLAKKLGQVEIRVSETHVAVEFEDVAWTMRREAINHGPAPKGATSGYYPNWQMLLPDAADTETTLEVDRDDLLSAARAAGVMASRHAPLKLILKKGSASVRAGLRPGDNYMRGELDSASYEGGDIEIGFNPDFLADICSNAPVERLTLRLISPLRPMLVEAARDEYLLMPVRLNV